MTSTCGNRLLQADPEAVCAEIWNTNVKRCNVRETHMLRCMHLGTQAKTKTMQEPLGGQTSPCHSGTPRKPKATSVLSPKQLHLQGRQGQDSKPSQTCKLSFLGPSSTPPPSSQAVRGA